MSRALFDLFDFTSGVIRKPWQLKVLDHNLTKPTVNHYGSLQVYQGTCKVLELIDKTDKECHVRVWICKSGTSLSR